MFSNIKKEAKKLGFLTYKFVSSANIEVPDTMFISPRGHIFFMDFEIGTVELTGLKKKIRNELLNYKIDIYVVRDIDQGLDILKYYMGNIFFIDTRYLGKLESPINENIIIRAEERYEGYGGYAHWRKS